MALSLSLPLGRNIPSPICSRCALRIRLLYLQQRRLRSTSRSSHSYRPVIKKVFALGSNADDDSPPEILKHTYSKGMMENPGNSRIQQWGRNRDMLFPEAFRRAMKLAKSELQDAPVVEQLARDNEEDEDLSVGSFTKLWRAFSDTMFKEENNDIAVIGASSPRGTTPYENLRIVYKDRGASGLQERIKYAFYGHVTNSRFTKSDIRNQQGVADLRYPSEWFSQTRSVARSVHLHVGPTNSGKTYQALRKLEEAERGVYAGPLRLLAHEVYTRLNAKGKPCSLITGEERRLPEGATTMGDISACTVEMMPMGKDLDVAVIDEIQMIGSAERGWAWTQALMGVKATEVHLCGETRTVPLIKQICASLGDKLTVHQYKRLSPLQMSEKSLNGDLKLLRKGDCIVSFSVMGIHALRKQIENTTGRKVAIVYGGLPPETRAQQARLFNDPNNDYDYLVASDAVGMGLNLAIRRIIFETTSKFDGVQRRTLSVADIKQIGGRAGRFKTAAQVNETPIAEQDLAAAKGDAADEPAKEHQRQEDGVAENVGIVTTLEDFDFPIVQAAMESEPKPITSAGLFPPVSVVERFSSYFPPGTPFSYMINRLHELSQMNKRFHLCGLKDQCWVADLIEPVKELTVSDRINICAVPASQSDQQLWGKLLPAFARCIAGHTSGSLLDIKELPLEILDAKIATGREYLRALEGLHKSIVAYLWLSYRFAGVFNTRPLADHVKSLVEQKIEQVIGQLSFSAKNRRLLAKRREQEMTEAAQREKASLAASSLEVGKEPNGEGDVDSEDGDAQESLVASSDESDEAPSTEQHENPELDGTAQQPHTVSELDSQTIFAGGGDQFAGEEYLTLEEEPEQAAEDTNDTPNPQDETPPDVREDDESHLKEN